MPKKAIAKITPIQPEMGIETFIKPEYRINDEMSLYSVKEMAELFKVEPSTVYYWRKRGYIKTVELTKQGKTGRAGRIYITLQEIQEIDMAGRLMLVETRRHWVRMRYNAAHGKPVR